MGSAPPDDAPPPSAPGVRRQVLQLAGIAGAAWALAEGWRWIVDARTGRRAADAAATRRVRMLSSRTCAVCVRARDWMTRHGVAFDECFIEDDAGCQAELQAQRAPGTPVFVVGRRRLVGFDPARLAALLDEAA
jgi:glutaredoxin